ncbi:SH3 domain-containing protein [Tessaracoccus rhinocerotis]|uniref:SH3 domain-containing protein n=1 Tax=Tessaracoccus rhinocerotis TaxID=1689449 RepID=A0A553K5M2_9ACTN|nr:SH3 domain-containing protein [Tessaracoccus rhinocerotis]TRY20007.1 SH3 domain-containing protein [Tessaracoccus rhinocerotis]
MNRVLKGLRGIAIAGTMAALVQGTANVALSLSAEAAGTQLTATTAVNVRSGPSVTNSRVGILYKGEKVTAGSSKNGWTEVTWGGKTAYVATAYLTTGSVAKNAAPSPAASAAQGTVYTTSNLNLRVGPTINDPVSVVATQGTKLALTGKISGSYSQVQYNSSTLWAATGYLSSSEGAPTQSLPAVKQKARATTALMIRTTSGRDFKSLGDVPRGTILELTGTVQNNMAQVVWQSNVRWVNNSYLTRLTETVPTAPDVPDTTTQYATANLNIWHAATGDAHTGEIPRGSAVSVTGTVTSGRAQIVHNGALRWVTAKYLSASKPSEPAPPPSGGGADRGDINKGYSSGLDKTNANVQRIAWHVWDHYPQIKTQYGWRRDVTPDHPAGRAVDVMIPNYKNNSALGWEIAKYFRAHASEFNINYIIFDQKIWSVARNKEGWRSMANRGGDTANHKDHVHINTYG